MNSYEFEDGAGAQLVIEQRVMPTGSTLLEFQAADVYVRPHQLPEIVRNAYALAGLPVPDLPDIPDPAVVEALCNDLRDAMYDHRADRRPATESFGEALDATARELLARGWGRTS